MNTSEPVRIRLRYADLDTFVERFAANVTRGGVFLASRALRPVGTLVSFEVQLRGGEVVLAGQGKVSWVKELDPGQPTRPFGMGVQFVSLSPATRPILARLLRAKEAAGGGRRGSGRVHPLEGGGASPLNGRAKAIAVDTNVDLAAEYGIDESRLQRVLDRTLDRSWRLGNVSAEELDQLLKPEPVDTPTLAQALADIPRLLDTQTSRRRGISGAFRPLEPAPNETDTAKSQPERDRSAKTEAEG